MKALELVELVRDAVASGALPSRVLPTPGEDEGAWSKAEARSYALVQAWLMGELPLDLESEVDLQIYLRLSDLAEEMDLGPWVRYLPQAKAGVAESPEPLEPKEAARRIAAGEKGVPGRRDRGYLGAVARHLAREAAIREAEERVRTLLTRRENARVTPRDTRVILGRLRAGKPVWVRATEEEFEALVAEVARQLARKQGDFLPPGWAWTRNEDRPHPRVLAGLKALWALVREEAEARRALAAERRLQPQDPGGPHKDFLGKALLLLWGLGLEADPTDPVEALQAVEEALARLKGRREVELLLTEEELAALEVDGPVVPAGWVRAQLMAARRRIEGRGPALPESWHRGVAEFLSRVKPMPQRRAKEAFARGQGGDQKAAWAIAVEAAVGALEVYLRYPSLREEAVVLAWETALEAVREQRSPYHHPGAYAQRRAQYRAPYLAEVRRQAVAMDEATAAALARLRRVFRKHPGLGLEELAEKAGVPVEWAEAAMPLVDPAWSLEEPIPGTDGLRVEDGVAGGEDPAEVAEREVVRQKVRKALEALPEWVRAPLWMVLAEGLPLEDVAEALGIPVEEVEARVALGSNQLRFDPELAALAGA